MHFSDFSAVQVRIARPTDRFDEIVAFYEKGLGLKKLGGFSGHHGYNGVMFGLPNVQYHLEFTSHIEGSPCAAPPKTICSFFIFLIRRKSEHIK